MSCFAAVRLGGIVTVLMLIAGCDGASTPVAQSQPAPETRPFFVGRWAAAETACGHAAWMFTADGLATPGEVSCTFN